MSFLHDVTVLNRFGKKCMEHHIPLFPSLISVCKRLLFPACDIPFSVEIGKKVVFPHRGIGVVVNGNSQIGDDTKIEANVCLGGKNGGSPSIGRNCYIGAGAVILGGVKIGDNCRIGANAVVLQDLPDGSVAVGIPARIIKTVSDGRPGKKD